LRVKRCLPRKKELMSFKILNDFNYLLVSGSFNSICQVNELLIVAVVIITIIVIVIIVNVVGIEELRLEPQKKH
jgi:hypothetical protein